MLIGQSAGDLAGLERKLLNELDDQPGRKSAGNGDNGHRRQPKKETRQTTEAATSKAARCSPAKWVSAACRRVPFLTDNREVVSSNQAPATTILFPFSKFCGPCNHPN